MTADHGGISGDTQQSPLVLHAAQVPTHVIHCLSSHSTRSNPGSSAGDCNHRRGLMPMAEEAHEHGERRQHDAEHEEQREVEVWTERLELRWYGCGATRETVPRAARIMLRRRGRPAGVGWASAGSPERSAVRGRGALCGCWWAGVKRMSVGWAQTPALMVMVVDLGFPDERCDVLLV